MHLNIRRYAVQVVLAQGTYTAVGSLVASFLPPFDLTLTAQTTALIEVFFFLIFSSLYIDHIYLMFSFLPIDLAQFYHMQVDKDEASRLSSMPSMVVQVIPTLFFNVPKLSCLKLLLTLLSLELYITLQLEPSRYTYILPPILYPNGRHYLKFGAHDLSRELYTKESIGKNTSRSKLMNTCRRT